MMPGNQVPTFFLKDGKHFLLFRKALFWDIPLSNIDLKKNKRLIIERVFSRGNLKEYTQLIKYYSVQEIKRELKKIRTFDKKTLNFISGIYGIKLKELYGSQSNS